jgi:hypothetical protein
MEWYAEAEAEIGFVQIVVRARSNEPRRKGFQTRRERLAWSRETQETEYHVVDEYSGPPFYDRQDEFETLQSSEKARG